MAVQAVPTKRELPANRGYNLFSIWPWGRRRVHHPGNHLTLAASSLVVSTAAGLPVGLQDGTNTYVYGLDLISATDGAGMQTYYLYDGLGSTTDLTDGSGNSTAGYGYDVFGAIHSQSGASANPWLFTGEQRDSDSSMYYLRARYYDPSIGRFLGQDPVSGLVLFPSTQNPYTYALSNPANVVDPAGLCPPTFCVPAVGGCTIGPGGCVIGAGVGIVATGAVITCGATGGCREAVTDVGEDVLGFAKGLFSKKKGQDVQQQLQSIESLSAEFHRESCYPERGSSVVTARRTLYNNIMKHYNKLRTNAQRAEARDSMARYGVTNPDCEVYGPPVPILIGEKPPSSR